MHNLSPVQSLRERGSGGRESIRGPQKLGLCEGSVYCQGVRSDCGPLLFGDKPIFCCKCCTNVNFNI